MEKDVRNLLTPELKEKNKKYNRAVKAIFALTIILSAGGAGAAIGCVADAYANRNEFKETQYYVETDNNEEILHQMEDCPDSSYYERFNKDKNALAIVTVVSLAIPLASFAASMPIADKIDKIDKELEKRKKAEEEKFSSENIFGI